MLGATGEGFSLARAPHMKTDYCINQDYPTPYALTLPDPLPRPPARLLGVQRVFGSFSLAIGKATKLVDELSMN